MTQEKPCIPLKQSLRAFLTDWTMLHLLSDGETINVGGKEKFQSNLELIDVNELICNIMKLIL